MSGDDGERPARDVRDPRRRLRKVARIARWEVSHSVGRMDRRTVALVAVAVVLGLFGAATLLPGSPANTIARLAIDSADATVYATVAGYVLLGLGAYLGVGTLVQRVDVGALS